jgi:hypothetical protein
MESDRALPLAPALAHAPAWLNRLESRPVIGGGLVVSGALIAAPSLGSPPRAAAGPASQLILGLVQPVGPGGLMAGASGLVLTPTGRPLQVVCGAVRPCCRGAPPCGGAALRVPVTRGVENWFSGGAVVRLATVARSCLQEQQATSQPWAGHGDLLRRRADPGRPSCSASSSGPRQRQRLLRAYLIDRQGRAGRAERPVGPIWRPPPVSRPRTKEPSPPRVRVTVRSVYRLKPGDAYLMWPAVIGGSSPTSRGYASSHLSRGWAGKRIQAASC